MSTVKKCDDPRCGQIDDGYRPVKVGPTVITVQRNGHTITFSDDLCDPCFHDLIETIRPRLAIMQGKKEKVPA